MKRYRIYVGRVGGTGHESSRWHHEAVTKAAADLFQGCTTFESVGVWKGMLEPSTVVEIVDISGDVTRPQIDHAATVLAEAFRQDAVLVTVEEIESAHFVGGGLANI
jgi:hypothetical protein